MSIKEVIMAAPKCLLLSTFRAIVLTASVAGVAQAAGAQDVGAAGAATAGGEACRQGR
jgi:hypothetical protein